MQFFALTDLGKYRTNNEDSFTTKEIGEYTVLILADGMGGANGGEIASSTAIESVLENITEALEKSPALSELPGILARAVNQANAKVYKLSLSDYSLKGMGTTLEVCIIKENTIYIAHIGDSRVYKTDANGEITRLTKDHSLVEFMIDAGTLTPEEAVNHPQKNIITKALGTTATVEADIFSRTLEEGDVLLLCSDGLSNMLSEKEIACVAGEPLPLSEKGATLVQMANDAGGTDNITLIIAQL